MLLDLKETVQINRPPEAVWPYLGNAQGMQEWNPQIREVVPASWGAWTPGCRFRITYAMSGQGHEFAGEIEECQEPEKLVLHLTGGSLPPSGYLQEVYELSRTARGTSVTQHLRIHNPAVHPLLLWLIRFLHRFGRRTGRGYLKRLKKLVETSA